MHPCNVGLSKMELHYALVFSKLNIQSMSIACISIEIQVRDDFFHDDLSIDELPCGGTGEAFFVIRRISDPINHGTSEPAVVPMKR